MYPIGYVKIISIDFYTLKGTINRMNNIGEFVKNKRKKANLTQPELAERAGVGLRFIRELESNKETLRLDKVDQVLKLFGHTLGPVPIKREDD